MDKLDVSLFYNLTKAITYIVCWLHTLLCLIFVQPQKIGAKKKAQEDPGLPNVLNSLQRHFTLTHHSVLFTLGDDASLSKSNNPKFNCFVKKCSGAIFFPCNCNIDDSQEKHNLKVTTF